MHHQGTRSKICQPTRTRMNPEVLKAAQKITQELAAQGQIMEGGWRAFLLIAQPPPFQHKMLREAYYAGAQHLWGSIMSLLDPGAEPTENDMKRMTLINEELNR